MQGDGFNPPVVRRFQMEDLKRVMQISTKSLSEKYSEDLMFEIFSVVARRFPCVRTGSGH